MADVTTTELKNKTAAVIQRVIAGEEITLTTHGREVAKMTPIRGDGHAQENSDAGKRKRRPKQVSV